MRPIRPTKIGRVILDQPAARPQSTLGRHHRQARIDRAALRVPLMLAPLAGDLAERSDRQELATELAVAASPHFLAIFPAFGGAYREPALRVASHAM
jgi:hypothetical protein